MKSLATIAKGPAPWLAEERNRLSRAKGRDANRIRRALVQYGIELFGATDRIPTDLGDILEVLRHLKLSVNSLTSGQDKPNKKVARALLAQIRNDLYIHLDYHFEGLKEPLDVLIEKLDNQQGGRGNMRRTRRRSTKSDFSRLLSQSKK